MDLNSINNNALFFHLLQNPSLGIFVYDRNLCLVEWNSFMEKTTGIKKENCLKKNIYEVVTTLDHKVDDTTLQRAFNGESFVVHERPIIYNSFNGKVHFFSFYYSPLTLKDSSIPYVLVIAQKAAEKQLEIEEKLTQTLNVFTSFLQYAPMPIYMVSTEGKILLANDKFSSSLNHQSTVGCSINDIMPKEGAELLHKQIHKITETDTPILDYESQAVNNEEAHFFTIKFPVRNAKDEIIAIGAYAVDITEKIKQEQEIKQLFSKAQEVNALLEARNDELAAHKEMLTYINKKLSRQKEELETALKELSDRNYELDQIMYKTSHDLRAPLTSILGLISLIRAEQDKQQLVQYYDYIQNRVEKLDTFVKSMLTYAKSSRTSINHESIKWADILIESLENLEYLKNFSKIRKDINIDETNEVFYSDTFRLNIIFNNLLGNAIKYADLFKPDPFIKVSITVHNNKATIIIEDNGIGIDSGALPKIGEMFFRATNATEGSGLGMYIVKQTIERLQGTFTIESNKREGTKITIVLPQLLPTREDSQAKD